MRNVGIGLLIGGAALMAGGGA
ncbi:unnamed protein product, partial [Rotaria sp. Silwood1]